MPKYFLLILLLIFLFLLNGAVAYSNNTKRVSSLRLAKIDRQLNKINKPSIRSIQSPDGDIIDCVHTHKQPTLYHPLLCNHKIQMEAPKRPKFRDGRIVMKNYTDEIRGAWQTWHHVGHCPKGTIPIRRSSVDNVLRAKSLYHFGKKQRRMVKSVMRNSNAPDVVSGNGHEHAIAYTGTAQEVYGAKAIINVWNPSIEESNEFSLSQIWVLLGSFDGSDLNNIEAGWQSGFIQMNNRIAIGVAISPISSNSGTQFDITILIWKDPKLGHWWMSFGDNALVGDWPTDLFTHLADHTTMVEWGGEVVNMHSNGEHTSTKMGSGIDLATTLERIEKNFVISDPRLRDYS